MSMLPGLGGMGMGKMKGLDDEQTAEAEKNMARMEVNHLFHDCGREKKSGSSKSFKKASVSQKAQVWTSVK